MKENDVPNPEEFYGFSIGADKNLARWNKIVNYFQILDKKSDKINVIELGNSTEGNPFLMAIITSSDNMKNLNKIREISLRLAFSEDLTESEAESLIKTGKTVIAMGMSIHANEVGGTQMVSELAYELITSDSPETSRILNETVLLVVPSVNPDGNIKVVDWYNKWIGTEYEGCDLPWLYHKYTGHDNNRDLVMLNTVENRMMAKILFKDWFPQAYIDFHHFGNYGARYNIPPMANPADPDVDPIIWAEQQLYGGAMMMKLEQAGKTGIENYLTFTGEFRPTYTQVSIYHGICGMVTESASVKIATPMYIQFHQLQPAGKMRPEYRTQINFPHPWTGGWWHLRDIVEQQKISAFAALEVAAKYREVILRNLYLKSKRSAEKGKTESPYAFIFHPYQHDIITTLKFLQTLLDLGIKIHKAEDEFTVDHVTHPGGSHIIFLSQIARPYLLATLRQNTYHESPWVKTPEGAPIRRDLPGYNLAEFMGVTVSEAARKFEVNVSEVEAIAFPNGSIEGISKHGYILDVRTNESFKAVNRLLKKNFRVYRVEEEVKVREIMLPMGSFYFPDQEGLYDVVNEEAKTLHLTFYAPQSDPDIKMHEIKPQRIAVYQRYYGGNMDEGWTRWLLENYEFDYTSVMDEEIKKGIEDNYDILIFPSDPTPMITGEGLEEHYEERLRGFPLYPPEYLSGIGKDGVDKVKEFISSGGTVLTLNEASKFAIEELNLPITNVIKDLKTTEFSCMGSTLNVDIDKDSRLAWGIQEKCYIVFYGSPAFAVKPIRGAGANNENYRVVASYPDENIMQSGWLIGETHISRKAALIDAKLGDGRIVLYGFPPQLRGQTHSTFKFLFNALLL